MKNYAVKYEEYSVYENGYGRTKTGNFSKNADTYEEGIKKLQNKVLDHPTYVETIKMYRADNNQLIMEYAKETGWNILSTEDFGVEI